MEQEEIFYDREQYIQAQEAFNSGNDLGALRICREILNRHPYDHPTLFLTAVIFEIRKHYERAVLLIERICLGGASNAMKIRILPNLAMDYCELRQYKKALYWCREGLKIAPDNFIFNQNAGYILNQQKRYRESLPYHLKAIAINQKDWGAWGNLGEAYFNMGMFNRARQAVLSACEFLEPGHPKREYNEKPDHGNRYNASYVVFE